MLLGAPQAINACHRGHYEGLIRCRLVGRCGLPGENFCTSFARLTQSRAISQSITFSSLSDKWETKKFHFSSFFKTLFIQNYRFLSRSHGGESAGDGRSTLKSTCADPAWSLTAWFGDRPATGMSKLSASVNSDLGNCSFRLEIPHAEHVDRCCWNMRE